MRRLFTWLGKVLKRGLKWVTYQVSRLVTGATLVGGALVGITTVRGEKQLGRLAVAGMAFIVGLPIGLMIFGIHFNMFIWLSIVVLTLFLMNLHNTWEVIAALMSGGLDHVMISEAVAAVDAVTPSAEDWKDLNRRIKRIQGNLNFNVMDDGRARLTKQLRAAEVSDG